MYSVNTAFDSRNYLESIIAPANIVPYQITAHLLRDRYGTYWTVIPHLLRIFIFWGVGALYRWYIKKFKIRLIHNEMESIKILYDIFDSKLFRVFIVKQHYIVWLCYIDCNSLYIGCVFSNSNYVKETL